MDDAAELQTIRDRLLSLEHQDREIWRAHRALTTRHDELEELVENMTQAEKITAAVAKGIRDERRALLNLPRKAAVALLAVLVAVPAAHDLATWF